MTRKLSNSQTLNLLREALKEDIGKGDITSKLTIPTNKKVSALIRSKETGILAGIDITQEVFHLVNPRLKFVKVLKDGSKLKKGVVIARISGDARSILTAERTALNFLQHLSGVATLTNKFVKAVKRTKAKVLDTRKTIPGLRALQKYAVKVGGGYNHRFGLYDRVLIKENHIIAAGGLTEAIRRADSGIWKSESIEVEARNLEQVKEALSLGVKWIMLDNMGIKEMREAVKLGKGRCKFEASGGVNLKNVRKIAATGVDYISVGALTHSVKALDISLKIYERRKEVL